MDTTPLALLIVDDEPLARLRLATLVRELDSPRCTVAGEAANAAEALAWLESQRCDVLLLDIQMPGASGTELAAQLQARADAPAVVFVTAHAEHALQAFELDAVDYLTKPVRRERLQAALQKAAQRRAVPPAIDRPSLVVSDRGRVVRVPIDEVLYLKAELKYVTLRTATHSWVLDDALTDLEQRLPAAQFLRVHRNALVARRSVRALEKRAAADGDEEGWAVQVAATGEWLAVSRRQVSAVREALEAG